MAEIRSGSLMSEEIMLGAYRISLSLSPISLAAQAASKKAISGNVG